MSPHAVGNSHRIGFWDSAGGGQLGEHDLDVSLGWPLQIRTDVSGVAAVCGHAGGVVSLTDVSSGQILGAGHAHTDVVGAIVVSHDSRLVVSGAADGTIAVWRMPQVCCGCAPPRRDDSWLRWVLSPLSSVTEAQSRRSPYSRFDHRSQPALWLVLRLPLAIRYSPFSYFSCYHKYYHVASTSTATLP